MTYGGDPTINRAIELEAHSFQAFIRVMPHSEYPSGSACLCTTYREFSDGFTSQHYSGVMNDIPYGPKAGGHSNNCNGEVGEGLPTVGCSYSFSLKDMTELEEVCGQSRLWGGMHFTKSVPAGHELCGGLGTLALERVNELMADSDFAGNEWFQGDSRPVCSDPSMTVGGESVVNREGSSSAAKSGVKIGLAAGILGVVADVMLL